MLVLVPKDQNAVLVLVLGLEGQVLVLGCLVLVLVGLVLVLGLKVTYSY